MSEECKEIWERQVEELLEIDDIGQFVSEDVLDIKRIQYENTGYGNKLSTWETKEFILTTATGGPSVKIYTRGYIEVLWWNESYGASAPDDARKVIDEIDDYLKAAFRC